MKLIKKTFTERNLVVILFVLVLVTFTLAQSESKKLDRIYMGFKIKMASPYVTAESQKAAKLRLMTKPGSGIN
jgi:hypothetical protein